MTTSFTSSRAARHGQRTQTVSTTRTKASMASLARQFAALTAPAHVPAERRGQTTSVTQTARPRPDQTAAINVTQKPPARPKYDFRDTVGTRPLAPCNSYKSATHVLAGASSRGAVTPAASTQSTTNGTCSTTPSRTHSAGGSDERRRHQPGDDRRTRRAATTDEHRRGRPGRLRVPLEPGASQPATGDSGATSQSATSPST